MPSRRSLRPSERFRVFTRDDFRCVYCGRGAPDVELHVDHFVPLAEGGPDVEENFVTACAECNGGKGARLIGGRRAEEIKARLARAAEVETTDTMARENFVLIAKQRRRASERRLRELIDFCNWLLRPMELTDSGIEAMKARLKRFDHEELVVAMEIAADTYLVPRADGTGCTADSARVFVDKLGGILANRRDGIDGRTAQRLAYAKAILRNRFRVEDWEVIDGLKAAIKRGVEVEEVVEAARTAYDLDDFWQLVGDEGAPDP